MYTVCFFDDGSFTNYAKHELVISENSPKHESDDLFFLFYDWERNEKKINVSLKANKLSSEKKTKPVVEIKKNETVKESRFTEVDEQFVTNFVLEHENANTRRKTMGHLKLLEEYLEKKNEMRPIHEVPAPALNSILSRFFLSIRQNDGSEYELTTLRGMMGSFERYLKRNRYKCSLVYGPEFYQAREALKSKQKDLKKKGKGNKPKNADAVTDDDINKLYEHSILGPSTPSSLLNTL